MGGPEFQAGMRALCEAHLARQIKANEAWVDGINKLFADHKPAADCQDKARDYVDALLIEIGRMKARLKTYEEMPLSRGEDHSLNILADAVKDEPALERSN